MRLALAAALALLGGSAACNGDERPGSVARLASLPGRPLPSPRPRTPAVADSSLSLDEALRRFRVGLPVVDRLSGGASSREALVRRLMRAVERRDTAAVRAMVVSRAEFAYLYYPNSAFTRDPNRQMAGLVWFFTQANSSKGITRVFERLGGRPIPYRGHQCRANPRREGSNLLWEGCLVRVDDPGLPGEVRLFGSIIERDGVLKFVSYANDF